MDETPYHSDEPHYDFLNFKAESRPSLTYSRSSSIDTDTYFVNTLTADKDGRERGPQLRATYCPKEEYESLPDVDVESLRDTFSTMPVKDRPEVWRRLLWQVLPDLLRRPRLALLASFLRISDDKLQERVMGDLFSFLFTSDSLQQEAGKYLDVEKEVWDALTRCHCKLRRCHLAALDAILWACLLFFHADFPNLDVSIEQRRKERLQAIQAVDEEECCQLSMSNLRHCLEIRKLTFSSPSHRTEEDIRDFVRKSRPCDRLVFVHRLLVELNTSTLQRGTEKDLGFLMEEIRKIKSRDSSAIFLLQVVFIRGIHEALSTKFQREEMMVGQAQPRLPTLMKAVKAAVESCSRLARTADVALELLAPHVFHSARVVKEDLLFLFNKYGKNNPMPRLEVKQVELLLGKGRFQVEETSVRPCKEGGHKPPCGWREFRGQLNGEFGPETVRGYVLSHGSRCLLEKDYTSCSRHTPIEHNLDIVLRLGQDPILTFLVAYQIQPFPTFYLVKDYRYDDKMLVKILQRRNDKDWFSLKELRDMVVDLVNALRHLHDRDIVLRDLTPYSLVLAQGKVIVTEFGSALQVQEGGHSGTPTDLEPKGVPLRWMGVESLWEGRFSPASDVYALGMTLYQLFTYGLEPFSELYTNEVDTVVHAILQSVAPMHWPCIPDRIHKLILDCVKPRHSDRLSLDNVHDMLLRNKEGIKEDKGIRPPMREMLARSQEAPRLDDNQILRHHMPEKGVPKVMTQRRQTTTQAQYANLEDQIYVRQRSQRPSLVRHWDSPNIQTKDGVTTVDEPMTRDFAFHVLPHLQRVLPSCLQPLAPYPEPRESDSDRDRLRQTRQYEAGDLLLDVALKSYGRMGRLLRVLLGLAKAVRMLHGQNCVYRDLSASTVLVTRKDEIRLPRLHRMRLLDSSLPEQERRVATDPKDFPDRRRWLPSETLVGGQFYLSSEVYMWAITAWEALQAFDFYRYNPRRAQSQLLPFYDVPDDQLRNRSLCKTTLVKPLACPPELFELLQRCWSRDRHQRPNMEEVVTEFEDILARREQREQPEAVTLRRETRSSPAFDHSRGGGTPKPRSEVLSYPVDLDRLGGSRPLQGRPQANRPARLSWSGSETQVKGFYLPEEEEDRSRTPEQPDPPFCNQHCDLDLAGVRPPRPHNPLAYVNFPSTPNLHASNFYEDVQSIVDDDYSAASIYYPNRRKGGKKGFLKNVRKALTKPFRGLRPRGLRRGEIDFEPSAGTPRSSGIQSRPLPQVPQDFRQALRMRTDRPLGRSTLPFRETMTQPLYSSGGTVEEAIGNPNPDEEPYNEGIQDINEDIYQEAELQVPPRCPVHATERYDQQGSGDASENANSADGDYLNPVYTPNSP